MTEIKIKPLTVNQAWKGRRFKTKKYTEYEKELYYLLPDIEIPEGNLKLVSEVGYSYSGSDIDNYLKPFLDVMQKRYGFNDSRIYKLEITKKLVKKGKEYIKFKFYE